MDPQSMQRLGLGHDYARPCRTSGANPVQGPVGDINCDGKLDGIDIGDVDGNASLDIVRMPGFSGGWLVEVWTR